MREIKLTPQGEPPLLGSLPEHWGEVELGPYAVLASADTATGRIEAMAAICGLPAAPLLEDTGLYGAILRAAPWLLNGPLPTALPEERGFVHLGQRYTHVGFLHNITASQLEALLGFLKDYEYAPLLAAPALLAVLFCPAGKEQTADVVEATTLAFATLPVAVGWPVLLDFLRSGESASRHILKYFAVMDSTRNLMLEMEAAAMAGASITFWQRRRRWLILQWLKYAKRLL